MHRISVCLTDYLIVNRIIADDVREDHIYGFEVLLGKIINYTTLLFLAYINGNFVQTLLFMMTFFPLRARTGGYHCKKAFTCYLGTFVIYMVVTNVVTKLFIEHTGIMILTIFLSAVIIYFLAPINHPNLGLDKEEIKQCKSSARWLMWLIGICVLVLWWLNIIPDKIVYIVAEVGVDAGLLITAKILRQEVKEE